MLNESKFRELSDRQQESGLTVKAFCLNEGIAESTFYYWRKKKLQKGNKTKDFIPLVVKPNEYLSSQGFTKDQPQVKDKEETADAVLLELVYPNGTRLRIRRDIDLTRLRALICLYD